jgi:hypothetical protein
MRPPDGAVIAEELEVGIRVGDEGRVAEEVVASKSV